MTDRKVTLKELSPNHKVAMSLLAQGMDRASIASIIDCTPEYVTWLAADPLCKEYIKHLNQAVDTQLEALYGKSVDIIADTMNNGAADEKLKAARLQMEATHRLGRTAGQGGDEPPPDRLNQLADRLLALMGERQQGVTYQPQSGDVIDATVVQSGSDVPIWNNPGATAPVVDNEEEVKRG